MAVSYLLQLSGPLKGWVNGDRMEDRGRIARGVFPRRWPGGPSELHAECLIEGLDPHVEVTVSFLQAIERQVLDAAGEPVDSLVVAGKRYASREEAAEREVRLAHLPDRAAALETAGGRRAELVENGAVAGFLRWRWEPLHATVEAWMEELAPGLRHVCVNVANRLEWSDEPREQTFLRTIYSTQVVMHSPDGAFASLSDPPPHLREASRGCRNEGLWPSPVGQTGDRRTILASPVPPADRRRPARETAAATSL
jgi:hypothetical protein